MELLHILRSEPDELARRLIDGLSRGATAREVALWRDAPDYDELVKDIFAARRVICWW